MTFLQIIHPLGWLVGAWYCRSLCRCLCMLRRHMIWVTWCIAGSEMDGAFNIYYSISTTLTSRADFISVNRSGRARAGHAFYSSTTSTVVRSRPHASRDLVAQHLATEPRLRPSFFVTVSWPPPPASSCRRADDLLRPAAAATSAPPFFFCG